MFRVFNTLRFKQIFIHIHGNWSVSQFSINSYSYSCFYKQIKGSRNASLIVVFSTYSNYDQEPLFRPYKFSVSHVRSFIQLWYSTHNWSFIFWTIPHPSAASLNNVEPAMLSSISFSANIRICKRFLEIFPDYDERVSEKIKCEYINLSLQLVAIVGRTVTKWNDTNRSLKSFYCWRDTTSLTQRLQQLECF